MKKEDLKNLTLEQLLQKEKTTKLIIGILIGALLTLAACAIYMLVLKVSMASSLALFATVPALLGIVPALLGSLKSIREEIHLRA